MKIQNLAIIFLIIVIPLIIILSYYLNLQRKTLQLQAEYNIKLGEATKEGIKAFEINTVDWKNYKGNARSNTVAAINAFITSLSNNLNISGTAKEYMINYIPAICTTMYDGYYIYAPNYVPVNKENKDGVQLFYDTSTRNQATTDTENAVSKNQILYEAKPGEGKTYFYKTYDEEGNEITEKLTNLTTDSNKAKKEYKHILSNQIQYSAQYSKGDLNVIVNYTLDNRIYVYGKKGEKNINKDGYLVYFDNDTVLPRIKINSNPRDESDIQVKETIVNTVYSKKYIPDTPEALRERQIKTKIQPEILEEQIEYKDSIGYKLGTFKYIYDIENEKLYYDDAKSNFFKLNDDKTKSYLDMSQSIKTGDSECKYKSVSVLLGDGETTEYKKIYQVLNGRDKGKWYIDLVENTKTVELDTEIKGEMLSNLGLADNNFAAIYKSFSDINYYVEAYAFTNWVKENLGGRITEYKLVYNEQNSNYERESVEIDNLFDISQANNPEKDNSQIVEHKKEIMKNHIITNLNLAIKNYSNGKYNFRIPVLTDLDWEQAFSNISLITFFQGIQIGLKFYNNYAIATSTTNREYVDPGEIYLSGEDNYYHRVYCSKCKNVDYTGYRSVDYVQKEGKNNIYYYPHDKSNNSDSEIACYYCVVNSQNFEENSDRDILYKQAKSYNEALARERYYQKEKLTANLGINITYYAGLTIENEIIAIHNIPETQTVNIGETAIIQGNNPTPTIDTSNPFIKYVFDGWTETRGSSTIKYLPGEETGILTQDIELYGVWRISLSNLNWKKDYYWELGTGNFSSGYQTLFEAIRAKAMEGWTMLGKVWEGNISYINISEVENKSKIEMIGNSVYPGKGAIWAKLESEYINIQKIEFKLDIDRGDSFNAGGLLFNVTDNGEYLKGYMFSVNFDGDFLTNSGSKFGSIYEFEYKIGANRNNVEKIKNVCSFDLPNYETGKTGEGRTGKHVGPTNIAIEVINTGYKISSDSLTEDIYIDVPADKMNRETINTFGFFSDHYKHGCADIGYFVLEDIRVTAVKEI